MIRYIEKNESLTKHKEAYKDLIKFLIIHENLKNDVKCKYFDKYFMSEKDISLLERNGFIRILRMKN